MSRDALTYTCTVCDEPAAAPMTAECNWCNGRYHLNQRNDVEAKDCGQVWVDEQFLALQFACNTCLAGTGRDPAARELQADPPAPARTSAPQPALNTRPRRYKRRP
jgi:hypothetical protein